MFMTHIGKVSEDMWDEELSMLMLAYQTSVQESTKFTLMFGREIKLPVDVVFRGGPAPEENYSEYVSHLQTRLEHAYLTAREQNLQAWKHQKQCYDRKVSGGHYTVGDKGVALLPSCSLTSCRKILPALEKCLQDS